MNDAAVAASAEQAAQVANAVKACGTLVRLEPEAFIRLLAKQERPLVVHAAPGGFSRTNRYLTSYKGLAFHCRTREALRIPGGAELILAKKISIPDV